MESSIFLLDNEPVYCHEVEAYLSAFGYQVTSSSSIEDATHQPVSQPIRLLLIGQELLNTASTKQLKTLSKQIDTKTEVIVLTRDHNENDIITSALTTHPLKTLYRNAPLSELRLFLPH